MTHVYSFLAALGLACLASTALLHRRTREVRRPTADEPDLVAWA